MTDTPVTKPVPSGPLAKEPAGTIGSSISFILAGIWLVLKVSGLEVTEDLSTGVELIIWGLLSIPALSGWLTRFFVVSPQTAQKDANAAATTGVAPSVMTTSRTVPKEKWGIYQGTGDGTV